jgi:putative DNA primase/helicase
MSEADQTDAIRAAFDRAESVPPVPGLAPPDRGGPTEPPPAPEEPPLPEAEAAKLPTNDIGNGRRLHVYFGEDLLRVPRLAWHVWTGTHWARDDDDLRVRTLAQRVSERILDELDYLPVADWERAAMDGLEGARSTIRALEGVGQLDEAEARRLTEARIALDRGEQAQAAVRGRRGKHVTWARTSGNSGRIDALLREGGVALSVGLDDLDADPLVVNCLSHTLRFRAVDARADGGGITAELRADPHRREDRLTKCVAAAYDPAAEAPTFDAFLRRIQPAAEMRRFLQRWWGLSMSGVPVQKLAFFHGIGANGKSVLVDLMCRIMDSYAATAPIEALTGQSRRSGSDATPELIPLIGARAVRSSEPEQGERFKEGMIKSLTSGEPIAVRALHSDFIFITTTFKLTISGNHKPEIRGTDDGIWRRVLLVPFDVQIPEAERDPDLGDKLWVERDGIFRWMVEGLLDYLEGGLQVPDAVSDATGDYRRDSDPVGAFLTECTVMDGGDDFLLAKDLIEAFNFWLEDAGETKWGGRTVSLRLVDKAGRWRHPASGRSMVRGKQRSKGYRGVRLTDTFRDHFERRPNRGQGGQSAYAEDDL